MQFYEVLAQVIELLQRQGRVSYRALKRQFDLDNEYLEDLKAEIIKAKRLAVDEDGDVLVWTGGTALPVASGPATDLERAPRSYTPAHLTEKILEARPSLEGERKQVTVLFADLKGSMELLADRGWAMASWPCLGRRWPMKIMPCAPAMPPCACRTPSAAMPRSCAKARGSMYRSGSGCTPARW